MHARFDLTVFANYLVLTFFACDGKRQTFVLFSDGWAGGSETRLRKDMRQFLLER
jgi:hypothetical protein